MSAPAEPGHDPGPTGTSNTAALAAVLFDMDGVVTDTADAHASAWKRLFDEYLRQRAERGDGDFDPFDAESDYRRYVDGMPRYDGVERFLRSRGIELERGDPADDPERETVCGLGNRKNGYFRDWLAHHTVRTYPSTVALIHRLRGAGIAVAVFSASRNCEAVLRNAGVSELFDTRVDGTDVERLDLPGKPDPAMLAEAASRLGARPQRTAVVEDSVAGVTAGASGGFQPVVGIDRGEYGDALADAGADIVVADAGELQLEEGARLTVKRTDRIPSALANLEQVHERLRERQPAVFLDYDGTLTPIVADPDRALLSESMRATLAALARSLPVTVISGRSLEGLRALVGLDGLVYCGSHGFEMHGPGVDATAERAEEFLPALDEAEATLRGRLTGIPGHMVERKPFDIAVHYRRVPDAEVQRVMQVVDEVVTGRPRLRRKHGKKVLQVQPRMEWDKGRAVLWLLERLGLDDDTVLPIYIGDDITDEDVFRVLAGRGIGIVVREDARATAADLALDDTDEVRRFLDELHRDGESST